MFNDVRFGLELSVIPFGTRKSIRFVDRSSWLRVDCKYGLDQ